MKSIKFLSVIVFISFFTGEISAQSFEECQKKISAMLDRAMAEEGGNGLTETEHDILLTKLKAKAKEEFPECFPKEGFNEFKKMKEINKKIGEEERISNTSHDGIDRNNSKYKEARKSCMENLREFIAKLQEKGKVALESAKSPGEKQQIRKDFQEHRSQILHECAISKLTVKPTPAEVKE